MGFKHRLVNNCELSPCEVALHRIQSENRVDYAGPLCGRPAGFWQEHDVRVLSTRGPSILDAANGDMSPMEQFLKSLFGDGRDSFFDDQFVTFGGRKDRISSNDQRIGPNKRRQTLWKITQ
jgi:hypothetical protein